MCTQMIILIVITTIASLMLALSFNTDNEDWQIISSIVFVMVIIFGWLLGGCLIPTNTTINPIPKNKIEVFVGKDELLTTLKCRSFGNTSKNYLKLFLVKCIYN